MRIPIQYAAIMPDNDVRTPGPKQQAELTVNLDGGKKQGPQQGMHLEYDTETRLLIAYKYDVDTRPMVIIPAERIRHMEPTDAWAYAALPKKDKPLKPVA